MGYYSVVNLFTMVLEKKKPTLIREITSGACDTLNINKGAILQCITVLLQYILQGNYTNVIAKYRSY